MQLPALCPNVERWLMVDIDDRRRPVRALAEAMAAAPDRAHRRRAARRGDALLVGHDRAAEGHPAAAARGWHPATPLRGHGVRAVDVPLPRGPDVPVAGAALPLGAAGERVGGDAARRHVGDHGELRPRAVPRPRRASTGSRTRQMVPTMFSRLLKLPDDVRAAADLSSLECIIHAAAPCPVPVKEQMIEWFGPIIIEYYGATEANGFTYCTSEEWLAHKGTVGKGILGELLILDDDGNAAADGHAGHRVVQGRDQLRVLQRAGEDGGVARTPRRRPAPSATSATSTTTATSTSPTARPT